MRRQQVYLAALLDQKAVPGREKLTLVATESAREAKAHEKCFMHRALHFQTSNLETINRRAVARRRLRVNVRLRSTRSGAQQLSLSS